MGALYPLEPSSRRQRRRQSASIIRSTLERWHVVSRGDQQRTHTTVLLTSTPPIILITSSVCHPSASGLKCNYNELANSNLLLGYGLSLPLEMTNDNTSRCGRLWPFSPLSKIYGSTSDGSKRNNR